MSEAKQMLFARNLVCLCIDDGRNADYQGKIWHQYSDEEISFDGIFDFLIKADELFDDWDFPQRSLDRRQFSHEEEHGHRPSTLPKLESRDEEELTIDKIQKQSGMRNIQNKRGKLGTFVIQVSFRQNATWQGHIIDSEKNEIREFISAMELVRIIDKTLSK